MEDKKLDKRISSILDANFGRLSEGLRVLEDMTRFILRDSEITKKLKEMRHSLSMESRQFNFEFLDSRGEDIGAFLTVPDEAKRENFTDLVIANAKRAEESLRVLEEYFKFLKILSWRKFQDNRFLLYSIEKEIVSRFLRQEKTKKLFPLYIILYDKYFLARRSPRGEGGDKRNPVELLKKVISGGAKAVQIRDKINNKFLFREESEINNKFLFREESEINNKRKILETALKLKEICQKANVLFLVNDYVDIALAVEADGVHLGEDDLPISAVRKILPFDKIIGSSVHNLKEAKKAEKEGADYISVGAIYPTSTKENAILVKPSLIREIKEKVSLPIIAIGGINENNLDKVMKFGVDGIAVAQAVLDKSSPKIAVKRILSKLKKHR
ncbi:thiamine phosphate synthase [Patescibacteria group bacterium]|nr:thiamine phosphate synthase [Patescibacteria group bacterium]